MRESVDEGDGTGRVREDGVPLFEEQVRGDDDRALLVATTDDLKEEIGRMGVVGEVPDLIDGQDLRARVGAQPNARARARSPARSDRAGGPTR